MGPGGVEGRIRTSALNPVAAPRTAQAEPSNPGARSPVQDTADGTEGPGRPATPAAPDPPSLTSIVARALNPDSRDEAEEALAAARGDADAFERLYRRTVPRIHSLARRMAGEGAADDLTQEVYLRAWSRLHTFRGDARFSTWLHRLAVNLILTRRASLRRDRDRTVSGVGLLERMTARVSRPGVRVDFEAALAALPEGARDVFILYDVEGYKHDEIGEMLGIQPGTSKSQLHRARMLLRRHLD